MVQEDKALKEDIQVIIDKEKKQWESFMLGVPISSWALDLKTNQLVYPNADRLLRIWINIFSKEEFKKIFLDMAKDEILHSYFPNSRGGKYLFCCTPQLFFYVMIKLGMVDQALKLVEERIYPSDTIFLLINDAKKEFLSYFTRHQINNLYGVVKKMPLFGIMSDDRENLLAELLDIRVELLDSSLNKINIELNQDKSNLMKQIADWGFDEKYNALLNNIDKYILSDDIHINSGMVNNLRTFMCDFAIELAEKISILEKEEIPRYEHIKNIQKIGRARRYIKEKLNLTEEENNLYDDLIGVLSDSGGHSFVSDKEYFRLARNMVVELALFVITKYARKYKIKSVKKEVFLEKPKLFFKKI